MQVAIVGRPNVGKSTLYNRLAGRSLALVHKTPGVTRDWNSTQIHLPSNLSLTLIDTAGLGEASDPFESMLYHHTLQRLHQVDVLLFVIDAQKGITALDQSLVQRIRRMSRTIVLVANKAEGSRCDPTAVFELGLGEPLWVSAEHGLGIMDVIDALQAINPDSREETLTENPDSREETLTEDEPDPPAITLALMGRQNVGKSTLLNCLVQDTRVLVDNRGGTTREPISLLWEWNQHRFQVIDTPGIRHHPRDPLETLSVSRSFQALSKAQVILLLADASNGLERQDLRLASWSADQGRSIICVLNKIDCFPNPTPALERVQATLEHALPQVRGIYVRAISALYRHGIEPLMQSVLEVYQLWNTRIGTAQLNRWVDEIVTRHPLPMVQGKRLKILYMTQAKRRPPTFILWLNRPGPVSESYRRYLVNQLREHFGLYGIPIRLQSRCTRRWSQPGSNR